MPNTRSRVEVEAVIKKMAGIVGFVTGPLVTFGANLAAMSAAYLQNGIGGAAVVNGGSGFTATTFTVPLPATAPGNAVPAVISFTNTAGVLSAPVVVNPGAGFGTAAFTFYPFDGSGVGAVVTITPANTDQVYNYSPSQAQSLLLEIANEYQVIGARLTGNHGGLTATAGAVDAGGSGYVVGDQPTVVQSGNSGCVLQVTSVGGGGAVTGFVFLSGGIGAAVATGLPTTGGSGTGLTINITATDPYDFSAATTEWAGWLF